MKSAPKRNLSNVLLGHLLLGHKIEPYQIWDAGYPNPVAVGHREKSEIACWRGRGVNLSNIRDGNDGCKRGWRYVYGWRVVGTEEPFYIGAATDWILRTKQEMDTALAGILTVDAHKHHGYEWLQILIAFQKYLPILFEENFGNIRQVLATTPQGCGCAHKHRPEMIKRVGNSEFYTSTWHSAKELMRCCVVLNNAFNAAVAAGKIKQTGGSSFSLL